ncbi:5528_t:CDS:2 [Paraglomus brasilianum]|uniref:5528_t:CDS:1 n=1 Tax=Paraglomus brasilianum TaxID=144538 RepID=A0A9N9AAM3_9GLOM|nr:5528_t:CDS:2 [Paraglomus brasilianum]
MPVKTIDNEADIKTCISSDKLTVLECLATHCSYCKAIAPRIDELSKQHPDVNFISIDLDKLVPTNLSFTPSATPTFAFYRNSVLLSTINAASLPTNESNSTSTQPALLPSVQSLVSLFSQKRKEVYNKLTEELAFSEQIEAQDLQKLANTGIKSVLDLCSEEGKGYVRDEKKLLSAEGILYANFPVESPTAITHLTMKKLEPHLKSLSKPLLIHSPAGLSAAIVALSYTAKEYGCGIEEITMWARDFGYDIEGLPEVMRFLQNYLNVSE